MSTVKADLIQNRLGTNAPTVTKGYFIKVWGWIDCNSSPTPIIKASFNFTSVTDGGPGNMGPNYTAQFVSNAYVVENTCQPTASVLHNFNDSIGKTGASAQCRHYENQTPYDTPTMDLMMAGALA